MRVVARNQRNQVIRATKKIINRLKRIISHSGSSHPVRMKRCLQDTFMAFSMTGTKDLLEERAKEKLLSFLEATRDMKTLHTCLLKYHKKSKAISITIYIVQLVQHCFFRKKTMIQ